MPLCLRQSGADACPAQGGKLGSHKGNLARFSTVGPEGPHREVPSQINKTNKPSQGCSSLSCSPCGQNGRDRYGASGHSLSLESIFVLTSQDQSVQLVQKDSETIFLIERIKHGLLQGVTTGSADI